MPLDEGVCICLALGIIALTLVYDNLSRRVIEHLSNPLKQTPSPIATTQITTQALLTTTPTVATPVTPVQSPFTSMSQDQAEHIKAQLESEHRAEWCKAYEREEVARYFRERFIEYEQNRQFEKEMRQNGIRYPGLTYGRQW